MSKKEYVKDNTRGRCPQVDPVNYKSDTLVQVWTDARKLVMLDNWLSKNYIYTRYMADIVKEVIDIVIEQLLEAGEVEKVEFSGDATNILKAKFNKVSLNPGGRGKRNIIHNLTLDDRRRGQMTRMSESDTGVVPGISRPISDERQTMMDEMWEQAQKRIREEEIKEAKEAISSRLTFDENGVVILPNTEGMYTAEDRKREIALTRERLGLGATGGSVGSSNSEPKPNQNQPSNECVEGDGEKGGQTPVSAEEALELFNKVRDKQTISAKQDLTPRKLTTHELEAKIEAIRKKDLELQSKLSSVLYDDLRPID